MFSADYTQVIGGTHQTKAGLMFVFAKIRGTMCRLLVDTGCSMGLMLHTRCAERVGVCLAKQQPATGGITVGDGHVVHASLGCKVTVNVGGYETHETPRIMELSQEFDGVLGKPWLEGIESRCAVNAPPRVSFQHTIAFTTVKQINGRNSFRITSAPPAVAVVCPRACNEYLNNVIHTCQLSKGARLNRVLQSGDILLTKDGSDFIMHDSEHTSPTPNHNSGDYSAAPSTPATQQQQQQQQRGDSVLHQRSEDGQPQRSEAVLTQRSDDGQQHRSEAGHDDMYAGLHELPAHATGGGTSHNHNQTLEYPLSKLGGNGSGGNYSINSVNSESHTVKTEQSDNNMLYTVEDTMVEDAIKKVDPRNTASPQPDPKWQPKDPLPEDDFTDPKLFERVVPKQNTREQLRKIEKETGISFVEELLIANGQLFSDEVPTRKVPSRGDCDASLDSPTQRTLETPFVENLIVLPQQRPEPWPKRFGTCCLEEPPVPAKARGKHLCSSYPRVTEGGVWHATIGT
jgi:hypothetical protein